MIPNWNARINEFINVFEEKNEEVEDERGDSKDGLVEQISSPTEAQGIGDGSSRRPGLVLFVPLVLGVGKVCFAICCCSGERCLLFVQIDDRYLRQLKTILTWPQSIGFIGGRSNSSLYFVGFQEENLLFLDPHKVQPATTSPHEMPTYFNAPLRHMPISSLITSLAIGFYCKSKGALLTVECFWMWGDWCADEVRDLMSTLSELEKNSDGAPILSFLPEEPVHATTDACTSDGVSSEESTSEIGEPDSDDDWEIL